MKMSEDIFRKKSLDKVKSPENLDDYIQVSSPSVWLFLLSVIILLAGACVWGIFGHIDSTVPATVRVEDGKAVCMISEEDISSVKVGLTVKFQGNETEIQSVGGRENNDYICELTGDFDLADGFFDGKVVTETYKPVSFIFN